jgi:hypothetical protein
MRPGGRRGVARKGGAQHGQERDDAKFGSLREIKRVVTSEDGAIVDDDALPDFADIAALVSDRICETLKHDSVAAARMAPTVVEAEARARLSNLLRDTCIAVVRSACGADVPPDIWTAWVNEVARAMDDEWFSAERDDADLGRSLVLAMQKAYEAQPQRSVVRNVILSLLRVVEGTDHAEGQQPLRIVRACAGRAAGIVSEPWNITEQMYAHGKIHAAVVSGGRVPAALPQKKLRGSERCLEVFCDWCRDVAFATRPWCNITVVGSDGLEYTTAKQMLVAPISLLYPEFCLHARQAGRSCRRNLQPKHVSPLA